MEEKYLLLLLLALFELYETSWQKSDSLLKMVNNSIRRYRIGAVGFFLSHPAYWFTIFVAMKFSLYNIWMITLLILKSLDMVFKLWIIEAHNKGKKIEEILGIPQDLRISPTLVYMNMIINLFIFYMALSFRF